MLTCESRARSKEKEAVMFERKHRYSKAIVSYRTANVIWQTVNNSRIKQIFCKSRIKQCIFKAQRAGLPIYEDE